MKKVFVLGMCALFIACGEANERGISSTTADSTAGGIAYNNLDTMPTGIKAPAAAAPAPAATISSDTSSAAKGPVPGTPAATSGQPAAATPKTDSEKPAAPAADNNADIKRGEALIAQSDCLACHKVQDKLLGPSYKDVANKYPNNASTISQLASKIQTGGSGVWGPIPMSPHPGLSDNDAKAMVKYILSLK